MARAKSLRNATEPTLETDGLDNVGTFGTATVLSRDSESIGDRMPWVFNIAYLCFLAFVSPVLLYRVIVRGKYRHGWREKLLGRLPPPPAGCEAPRIWLHAVSVGEVLQLQSVLKLLRRSRPDCCFVITTTTSTGYAVAREKFPTDQVCYFPLDFSWSVRTAIRRIAPSAVILVELELWPNFIFESKRAGVPLVLINGRMSERSFRGYRRLRPLMGPLLDCFDRIAVQSETYKARLIELGARAEKVEITGSIKFDDVETNRNNQQTQLLQSAFGIAENEPVFIAGSTQSPEEEYALDAWLEARRRYPDLRLILVPRHQERFEEVAKIIEARGLPLLRRSLLARGPATNTADCQQRPAKAATNPEASIPPVLLLDTLGELSACWGLADIAFVGGSLTDRGGQNMIEPAAYGAAVLFGPNTQNFRDVVELLLSSAAARVVHDQTEMTATLVEFLDRPDAARQQGELAKQLVLAQQGATGRTVVIIQSVIDKPVSNETKTIPGAVGPTAA